MATLNGPTQANGQIRWWYQVGGVTQGSVSVSVKVDAYYFQVAPYYQTFNGTKSWSGSWGSGSAAQAFNLGAGAQVKIVTWSSQFTLTDSAQKRSFTATARHWFGTTSHTLTITIPARYARTPGSLVVARNSDTSHRLNWSRTSTYTAVVIQRSVNGGGWTQVARPSGNAYTWTDTSTKAGNQYRYRVAGVGGSGQSGWSNTATVYTSPNTPTGVTATRNGNSITVDASGRPAYATGYTIRDGSTTVATNVQLPWTHAAPAPASTHTYTVQAVRGSLASGWSTASNTVQLISPPLAPTSLTPNGGVSSSDVDTVFKWKHNAVDSSTQTAAEFRLRFKGDTSWTVRTVTTPEQIKWLLSAGVFEWQVRTKGAHPDWSPYSAIATVTAIDRPGVAITAPEELWSKRTVDAEWSWAQVQGRPQSAWEAVLSSADGELERREGAGATRKVSFTSKLLDGVEYEVTVRAATGEIWSHMATQGFTVMVPPAAPARVQTAWSEETGSVTIEVADGRGEHVLPITNHFPNSRLAGSGQMVELARNLWKNSKLSEGRASIARTASVSKMTATSDGVRVDVTGELPGAAVSYVYTRERVPVLMGNEYSVQVPVRNSGRIALNLKVYVWTSAESGGNLSTDVRVLSLAPGAEDDAIFEGIVVPANATQLRFSIWWAASDNAQRPPIGSAFDLLDGLAVWAGPRSWGRATGELSSDPDFRARWSGAANASEAIIEGERVAGFNTATAVALITSVWEGKPAARLINIGAAFTSAYAGISMPLALRATGGVFIATRNQVGAVNAGAGAYNLMVSAPAVTIPATNVLEPVPNRLEFGPLTGTFSAYLGSRAFVGGGDVWWTEVGLFEPGYTGPAFNGSSGLVEIGESWMAAAWDGDIDKSTSTLRMAPAAVRVDVERSVDGGITWLPFITSSGIPVIETDAEALSRGVTYYRVTTYSTDDAASVVIYNAIPDSPAVWLSGGEGFTRAARLPYDPAVSITRGRERTVRRYAGRPKPVVHSGEAVTRTVDYGGTLILDEQSSAELEDLVADEAPTHLLRFPDGRHMYGAIGDVQLTREPHGDWTFGFQLTETEQ